MKEGIYGEIKESYFPVNILYSFIMSPLILLNLREGRLRILSLSSYDLCFRGIINFVALFWTFSNDSVSCRWWGLHTELAYSRWLLTNGLYNIIKASCFISLKFLLIMPSILFALLIWVAICSLKDISDWKITPNSLYEFNLTKVQTVPPLQIMGMWFIYLATIRDTLNTFVSIKV